MKKTVVVIIALFGLAVGTTHITSALAAQNELTSNTANGIDLINGTKKATNVQMQNGADELIADRSDSQIVVETLATTLPFKEKMVKPISLEERTESHDVIDTVHYTIKSGDTLENIATAFEVKVEELVGWNESLSEETHLQIGDEINIETDLDPETIDPQKVVWESEEQAKEETILSESPATEKDIEESSLNTSNGEETITVVATAYSRNQPSLTNITATGIDLRENSQVIAVDPNVIPLGSKVYVEGYGEAIAGDTGSAIIGNRIDLHMESMDQSFAWGIQEVELTILN
ncbi:3D domain-containing protein [Carnobacterium inhibens]|uniref:LysM peptidoglycan-binding domain-containing protein n=1 Tax=Carnobacterium inhibens TaxID=147709 RepID=A0ABR7T917_9LACT|nr:3D domain-containing protein [Carnobacterium inhibens]MBC9824217.1 LysM peptidoglycan-binding domain-containing protein [Carnobacterium inhibens]